MSNNVRSPGGATSRRWSRRADALSPSEGRILPGMRAPLALLLLLLALPACGAADTPQDSVEVGNAESPSATATAARRRPRRPIADPQVSYADCLRDLRNSATAAEFLDGGQELYGVAYAAELDKDLDKARRSYLSLIETQPKSAYVPAAYFAFGWMFGAEAATDPMKWAFVEQSMREVLKYPSGPLRLAAHVELARSIGRGETVGEAARELDAVDREITPTTKCGREIQAEAAKVRAGFATKVGP